MGRVLYEVIATILDQGIAEEWARWMLDEHIDEVLKAGASNARLVQIEDPRTVYVAQYEFPSRQAFDHYMTVHAPRLRQEGSRRFEPEQVTYARRIGEVVDR